MERAGPACFGSIIKARAELIWRLALIPGGRAGSVPFTSGRCTPAIPLWVGEQLGSSKTQSDSVYTPQASACAHP